MASTEIEIVNKGLFLCGEEEIASFSEQSVAAKVASVLYPLARDEVSRSHSWNCLLKQEILTKLVAVPPFENGFSTLYNLPADCVKVLSVNEDIGRGQRSKGRNLFPFMIIGRQMQTDVTTGINLTYIKRETDVTKFDATLVDVIASKLAADMVYKITGSTTNVQLLQGRYLAALRTGKSLDSREQGKWFQDSGTITHRTGNSGLL